MSETSLLTSTPSIASVRRRAEGDSTVVTLDGEVDVLTAPRVSAALDLLTGTDRPDIVVDLRPVDFIDCSGLSALVRARRRAEQQQGRVRLVCRDEFTLRTLRATRLAQYFTILPDWPDPTA
ncbi:STAS domain-containing protein [Streptomyces sp. NPDC058691]|uniref:STAS domain-containing protein n=1 Tax=Streptomyces sp. NPDC058691 TaxID=3346601 RepID=UPI00365E5E64